MFQLRKWLLPIPCLMGSEKPQSLPAIPAAHTFQHPVSQRGEHLLPPGCSQPEDLAATRAPGRERRCSLTLTAIISHDLVVCVACVSILHVPFSQSSTRQEFCSPPVTEGETEVQRNRIDSPKVTQLIRVASAGKCKPVRC